MHCAAEWYNRRSASQVSYRISHGSLMPRPWSCWATALFRVWRSKPITSLAGLLISVASPLKTRFCSGRSEPELASFCLPYAWTKRLRGRCSTNQQLCSGESRIADEAFLLAGQTIPRFYRRRIPANCPEWRRNLPTRSQKAAVTRCNALRDEIERRFPPRELSAEQKAEAFQEMVKDSLVQHNSLGGRKRKSTAGGTRTFGG